MKLKKGMRALSVLLILLLAGMALSAGVSAFGINGEADEEQLKLIGDPASGNLFHEFGLEEPKIVEGPTIKNYSETKSEIDLILEMGGFQDIKGDIVGLIDYDGSEIILLDQNETILEVIWDGSKASQHVIEPKLLGEREFKMYIPSDTDNSQGKMEGVQLSRIDIKLPTESGDIGIKTIYAVTVWREDWWDFFGNQNLLHTQGKFYVDYGIKVDSILDQTYVQTAGGCDRCEFTHYTSGAGTYVGQVTASAIWATLQAPTIKCSQDTWVSCDRNCNEDGNGVSDKWGAIGCGCLAIP
ncbi:MAG: hypothetical protein U9N40_02175 [Euryarchaeota archaeon]|nr:hypothetical protein [Euryarchaeota archaeon]